MKLYARQASLFVRKVRVMARPAFKSCELVR